MCRVLHCIGTVFSGEQLVMWLTFFAELLVAGVIYLELETTRRTNYIQTTNKDGANEQRAAIYEAYVEINATGFPERSMRFVEMMYKTPILKSNCDRQIELFNGLGLIISSRFTLNKKAYVRIFPHAAIYIWVILQSYLVSRRNDAGRFFAEPMLQFAVRCADFLIEQNRPLHLRRSNGSVGLTITVEDLKQIRSSLKAELEPKI